MEKTSKLGRDGAFWGLVMVAPTVIGLIVLNIYPFIDTIYMSFSKSLPFGEFEFEGIENYVEMFQSPEFWQATWNTILFCILTVPVGIFLALLVAVLLNSKIKGRTTFRAIFFLPMVVAPAAVAMVWKWIFNSQYGIINQLLDANIGWLTDQPDRPDHLLGGPDLEQHRLRRRFAAGRIAEHFGQPVRSRRPGRRVQGPPVLQHHTADGLSHPLCGPHHASDELAESL